MWRMYLLHVSLLTHRKLPSPLSFYAKDEISPGAIVEVYLRKEKMCGVVISTDLVTEHKSDIRAQTFQLKKVGTRDVLGHIDHPILRSYIESAEKECVPYTLLFDALLPEHIQGDVASIQKVLQNRYTGESRYTISYLESSSEERIPEYKSMVRDILAKKKSIHIIAPTVERVEKLASIIGKGITHKVYVLHGELSKKKLLQATQTILNDIDSVVVCSTPHFGLITPASTELTIVDEESHPSYYTFDTPRLDYIATFKHIWKHTSGRVIFADTILRIESYKDLEEKKVAREFSIHSRFSHQIPISLCTFQKDAPFTALTKEVLESLKKVRGPQLAFLYVARKGVHTSLQCTDCGTLVVCESCGKSVSVQERLGENRHIRCLYCNTKKYISEEQELICTTCGSWKIKGYGITTHLVGEEVRELLPNKNVYTLDRDMSEKNFKKTLVTWKESGGILIGTESALPYIDQKLHTAAIISCDAWFSVPDIDVHRRFIQVLEPLLEHCSNALFVQTRLPDEPVFALCKKENITDYIKQELKERKELQHTPYTTFILLRKEKSFSKSEADQLCELFPAAKPTIYKVHTDIRVLLRISEERFITDSDLHKKLQGLFPHIIVEINPPSLFFK